MQSIILITPEPLNLRAMAKSDENLKRVDILSDQRLVVEGDWGWFALNIDDAIRADFEADELADVLRVMTTSHFAQLEYSSAEAANAALKTLRIPETALIDNDHGLRVSFTEVRRRISLGVDWVNCAG